MIVTARCTACGRKTLRLDASTVATTIHRRTCKCGARYCLKVTPVIHNDQMTVHTIDGVPLPPRPHKGGHHDRT